MLTPSDKVRKSLSNLDPGEIAVFGKVGWRMIDMRPTTLDPAHIRVIAHRQAKKNGHEYRTETIAPGVVAVRREA